MNAARPLRYAGKYPCSLAVEDALREALSDSPVSGRPSSAVLRYGGFRTTGTGSAEVSESEYASAAERAYVRWLDLAYVCGVARAAALADWLRSNGYDAIRFAPLLQTPALIEPSDSTTARFAVRTLRVAVEEVAALLGERVATDLADELAGRAYVIPLMTWSAETARAILIDVQREAERNAILHLSDGDDWPPEHEPCAARIALFDACGGGL